MRDYSKHQAHALVLAFLLYVAQPRAGKAESRFDFKTLHYQESGGRMRIISPTFLYEYVPTPDLRIKVEFIYNSISGATPTGEPLVRSPTAMTTDYLVSGPSGASPESDSDSDSGASPGRGDDDEYEEDEEDEEDEEEEEDDDDDKNINARRRRSSSVSGASPVVNSSPNAGGGGEVVHDSLPLADVEDTRWGGSLEVSKRLGKHTIASQMAYSTEDDYESFGFALRDAIDLNDGSTILVVGGAISADTVQTFDTVSGASEEKDSTDLIVGITQLLTPESHMVCNLSLGHASGYLSDPYKVVELNGELVAERRPDSKSKQAVYLAHTKLWESVDGSSEVSYRLYNDDFGVTSHTMGMAWHQRFRGNFIIRPSARLYTQSKADFYGIRFTGDPSAYSSDYRVSEMMALHYGLKVVWFKTDHLRLDLAVERYEQSGLGNDAAPDEAYPSANVITGGLGLSL